jgi:hypothetical protein
MTDADAGEPLVADPAMTAVRFRIPSTGRSDHATRTVVGRLEAARETLSAIHVAFPMPCRNKDGAVLPGRFYFVGSLGEHQLDR